MNAILRYNEPLASYTSWAVGGPAKCFFEPAAVQDLALFLAQRAVAEDLLWIGLGSNLLIADAGFDGSVIRFGGSIANIRILDDCCIDCDAGAPCARVARTCAKAGCVGVEFLAGIPGTMGGALKMNAGAAGHALWEYVTRVRCIDRKGRVRTQAASEFDVAYRQVDGLGEGAFIGCELQLERGDAAASQRQIRDLLLLRDRRQPSRVRSCGSVFRNPPGDYAGRLIEASGLKGTACGGAVVSTRHANFIINSGAATASEINALMHLMKAEVHAAYGVWLQPEVQIAGALTAAPSQPVVKQPLLPRRVAAKGVERRTVADGGVPHGHLEVS